MFPVDQYSQQHVTKCEIGTITWSDHTPITLSILPTQPHPAPFMWKNNTFLFANLETQTVISSRLTEFFSLNTLSSQDSFNL